MPTYRITGPDGTVYRVTGDGTAEEALEQVRAGVGGNATEQPAPQEKPASAAKKIRNLLEPTVLGLSAVGGGLVGTGLGPAGTVAGAGLGYGMGKGAMRLYDQLIGDEKPPATVAQGLITGAGDVLEGATYEAGGRVVAPYLAKGIGRVVDWFPSNVAKVKAAKVARETIGPDIDAVRGALRQAGEGQTAAQATANVNSPTWQALAERASMRDPRFYGPTKSLTPTQEAQSLSTLQSMAGGGNQTAMRTGREAAAEALNERLIPTLKVELNAANTAGKLKPKLEAEAARMAEAASAKVGDVRRFTEAGGRAAERAANTTSVPGLPNTPGRYTYMGELEKRAEAVAAQAADASLPFGEAARFAQSAADSLAAHGLKPLKAAAVVSRINKTLSNPSFAGNKDVNLSLRQVSKDIAEWADGGGVIDAFALDAIRKNSVNGVIQRLYPAADKSQQKELAAAVLAKVKPVVIDAIERAGGTGYRQYLKDYTAGKQAISQTKMAADLTDAFKTNKKTFVDIVGGNAPRDVEKVFGPGRFDIAEQMGAGPMRDLSGISDIVLRSQKAGEQASAGQDALHRVLEKNISRWKIPWGLSPKTMAMNQALGKLEHKIGTKTMNLLAEAMKSGKTADEMLSALPAKDRVEVLRAMANKDAWLPGGYAGLFGDASYAKGEAQ